MNMNDLIGRIKMMKMKNILFVMVAAIGLAACGTNSNVPIAQSSGVTSLTGVVAKGPISGGTVTVVDSANPAHTYYAITDANGGYNVTLDSNSTAPYTLTITGGTDTITGKSPDFPVSTIVTQQPTAGLNQMNANANVLTTVIAAAAKAAAGGKTPTAAQLKAQEVAVVKSLGMGLPAGVSPTTDVTPANAGEISAANEALAEVIRRSTVASKATGVAATQTDFQDSMAAISADISDGALDGSTTQAALTNAGASANVTPASVVKKVADVAKSTSSVIREAAANGGAVNVTDSYGTVAVPAATVKQTLDRDTAAAITTLVTQNGGAAPTVAPIISPSTSAVVAQTSQSTAIATDVVKTATSNAQKALTAATGAIAGSALNLAAKQAVADAYTAAQAASAVTADNYTAAQAFAANAPAADVLVAKALLTSAQSAQTSAKSLLSSTASANTSAIADNLTAASGSTTTASSTATTAASAATTAANTAATVAAPVVLKAFVLSGNSLTYAGNAASTVDAYGAVATPAAAMTGTAITLSGTLRDLTGLGARTIITSFEFGVQQTGGVRKVKASISPVEIVVNTAGDVAVNVPANATITYSYINASGTGFNGTATNLAANNGIIVSNAGAFTVDASALANIITAKTNASMNILATVGTFAYKAGFINVPVGHVNAAGTAVDGLFTIDTAITGTRALNGTFSTK